MFQCYNDGDFKKYFNENMHALGLPVPAGLFETAETAIASSLAILKTLDTLGKGATMAEVAGATIFLEKAMVLGAIVAAGYVGAVIGSIAVATGRSLGCGYQISDMFVFLEHNNLKFKGWNGFYVHNAQILDRNHDFRSSFGMRCRSSACTFVYS